MKIMRHILTLTLILLAVVTAAAQVREDSVASKHQVLVDHLSIKNEANALMWQNPALMETAHATSLTQFGISIDWQRQSAAFELQQGTGHVLGSIKAQSYLRLSPRSAVWGKAGYMTGKNRDIKWNSVADYNLLKPDILGDTLGGDTRREQYTFEGGYSSRVGDHWRMGGEMLFRAEQEYRKVDPRMRSIVSDLSLRAGAARELGHYNVALGIEGNIYRQTNSVDFYKPLGSIPEYQLMGLGTLYTRFSGDINDLYFKGGGITLQADLMPNGAGVLATVRASQHHYERIARLLNSLPLTTLYNKEITARLGWKKEGTLDYAVWAHLKYNRRTSDQHIAGTSSSQVYPIIADLTMYKNNILATSLTAIIGRKAATIGWNVKAQAGYTSDEQEFVSPHRSMDYGHAWGTIDGQVIAALSRSFTITAMAGGGYCGSTNKSLTLPLANMEPHFIDMVNHNYRYLSTDYTTANVSLRTDYHLGRSRFSIYAQARYCYTHCSEREHQNNLMVSIGINL